MLSIHKIMWFVNYEFLKNRIYNAYKSLILNLYKNLTLIFLHLKIIELNIWIYLLHWNIIIERLNEIIFYDKWDINLNSNHDSTLNSFLEKDSFSQTSPMAL